ETRGRFSPSTSRRGPVVPPAQTARPCVASLCVRLPPWLRTQRTAAETPAPTNGQEDDASTPTSRSSEIAQDSYRGFRTDIAESVGTFRTRFATHHASAVE